MTIKPTPPANPTPTPKMAAAGAAGAVAIVLVWILSLYHIDMPDTVAAALAVLLTTAAGYLTPSRKP